MLASVAEQASLSLTRFLMPRLICLLFWCIDELEVLHADQITWAATWQNQQSGCAPSEDSDLPVHPPGLIRVFAVRMKKAWVLSYPLSTAKTLIRLGGCPGWSESSVGAHSFCLVCHVVAHLCVYESQQSKGESCSSVTPPSVTLGNLLLTVSRRCFCCDLF